MNIAVIGADGQLGADLCEVLRSSDVVPLTHADVEITDIESVKAAFNKYKPDMVINAAAFIRVDDCEDNPDNAFQVNAQGAGNVAMAASDHGATLMHISTDYVFGGEEEQRGRPYTEDDTPTPANVYGKSKLDGENLVRRLCPMYLIVRTSALFGTKGAWSKGGNFVETVLRLAGEKEELRVVNDQISSPTYTRDLAAKIAQLIITDNHGIFHITNKGSCSWYEFAVEILRLAGLKTPVLPVTSDQYPQKARRPNYSVLDNYHLRLLGMDDMRPWQEALKDYLERRQNG